MLASYELSMAYDTAYFIKKEFDSVIRAVKSVS